MVHNIFKGLGIALITPFKEDGSVDYEAILRLLDYQLSNGADFFCILATTGETPTLTAEEKLKIKDLIVDKVQGRVPILMGCGGYNTAATGVNMQAATTVRLARDCQNIVAIKEASGNLEQVDEIIKNKPNDFDVISGDDALTFPMVSCGAVGVISVIGNALPKEFSRMIRLQMRGEYDPARTIHHRFTDLFSLLFVDGNPAGVKAMLSEMGFIQNVLRLPLVPMRIKNMQRMSEILKELKI